MTTDPSIPARLPAKIRDVIAAALAALDPDDKAERIAYCQATGEHGTRLFIEGESLRFVWGGADLVLCERALIVDDDLDLPPVQRIDAPPDFVPTEWGDQ